MEDYTRSDAGAQRKHNLLTMSFAEVEERLQENGQDVVLVPLGSTEKHGAHIPLGTDSYVTMEVVERAAQAADVMYTPLERFGYSPHHMGRHLDGAGTITLAAETYRRIMNDVARSLIYHGFTKIISFYKTPTEREASVVQDLFDNPPEETPGWHSSELETACLMATAEGLVDMDRAVEDRAHAPAYMGDAFSKRDGTGTVEFQGSENIWVPMEHHEYSDTAVIGNPFRATKEKGLQMFERMAKHLTDFVDEVREFEVEIK